MVPFASCLLRDLSFILVSLTILVVYVAAMTRKVRILARQSDEVVNWHGIEVRNQDAHRERLERRFDEIEILVRRNGTILDQILAERSISKSKND